MMNRKIDPFGSMQGMLNQFRNFMGNPMSFMQQRNMQIPQGVNNPTDIIQNMLNNGQITQEQYNYVNQLKNQIQSNPQYQQYMSSMKH